MGNSNVVVYTSRDCSYCEKVLDKLTEWDVEYEERNVSEDRSHFRELQSMSVYGTPATFINGEKILGYQERKLKQSLGIRDDRFIQTDSMNFS